MRTLGVFTAIFLLGLGLQQIGIQLNTLVVKANGGQMPVLCLNDQTRMNLMGDSQHKPMDKTTRYPLLCDVLIVPIVDSWTVDKEIESLGDVFLDLAGLLFVSLYVLPFFFIGRKLWRRYGKPMVRNRHPLS